AIEILGENVAARELRPAETRQVGDQRFTELAFDVAIEESAFEVVEDPIAMERVIGGDDAAAGDCIDDVDLVEQSPGPSADLQRDVAQRLARSIRQRRCSRTAARGRDHDENVPRILRNGLHPSETITP